VGPFPYFFANSMWRLASASSGRTRAGCYSAYAATVKFMYFSARSQLD
jgi:hypothetical protein